MAISPIICSYPSIFNPSEGKVLFFKENTPPPENWVEQCKNIKFSLFGEEKNLSSSDIQNLYDIYLKYIDNLCSSVLIQDPNYKSVNSNTITAFLYCKALTYSDTDSSSGEPIPTSGFHFKLTIGINNYHSRKIINLNNCKINVSVPTKRMEGDMEIPVGSFPPESIFPLDSKVDENFSTNISNSKTVSHSFSAGIMGGFMGSWGSMETNSKTISTDYSYSIQDVNITPTQESLDSGEIGWNITMNNTETLNHTPSQENTYQCMQSFNFAVQNKNIPKEVKSLDIKVTINLAYNFFSIFEEDIIAYLKSSEFYINATHLQLGLPGRVPTKTLGSVANALIEAFVMLFPPGTFLANNTLPIVVEAQPIILEAKIPWPNNESKDQYGVSSGMSDL